MGSARWVFSSIFGLSKTVFAFTLVPASMYFQQMAAVLRENLLGGGELEKSLQVLEQKLIMLLAQKLRVKVWIDCLRLLALSPETYYSMIQAGAAVIFVKNET